MPGGLGHQLHDVGDLDPGFVSGGRQRTLRPDARADQHVDVELLGPGHAGVADRLGDLGLLDGQSAATPGAVGPLGDVIDVLEDQTRDRVEDEAGCLVDPLALVEPARVVIGHGLVDRFLELELAVLDQLGDQLDDLHHLDVEVRPEVRRIVLGEVDVVVRLDGDDALHAGGAPVRQVVLGEGPGLLDVAHLGRRATAAPLLVHQAELEARLLQHLGGGPRVRRPVERGLAVDEHDRLAADRDLQTFRPVADVLLAVGLAVLGAEHGLVLELVGQPVPELPTVPVQPLVDHQRPRGPYDLHRLGPGLIEVTDEQGVRAPDLTRSALGAVDVVVGDVGDVEQTLVHRDDVGVEGGRRVVLVPRHLHDRADLAAELVAGGEAVVAVLPPPLDELALELPVLTRCGSPAC